MPKIPMLKIYGRANSSNVRKVLWLLDEMGVPYEREDWGRGFRALTEPAFQKLNPYALVPVIDDDGFILSQSNTILRYLAQKHGRLDFYPPALKTRALVEAHLDWSGGDLPLAIRPVFFGVTLKMPGWTDETTINNGIAAWTREMMKVEADLARTGGPYLMGPNFTLADISMGIFVNRWFTIPFAKTDLPHVAKYYDTLALRPAYMTHGRNGTP